MKVIYTSNVNGALRRGLRYLKSHGVSEPSRNGPVLVAPGPVMTVYSRPWQRVLFLPTRDANPFFHLFEALWMLGGRNDVAYPAKFAAQLQLYSDDNVTLNGAYGYRWRHHFGYDQLQLIIEELKTNPASRRCVLAMWDAYDEGGDMSPGYEGDLKRGISGGKDIPCNTHVYFRVDPETARLDMTLCNRSNDVVWGAYGANAVHFSMLQEYVADKIGLRVGRLYQFANNYHIYTERPDVARLIEDRHYTLPYDLYKTGAACATALRAQEPGWDDDLEQFLALDLNVEVEAPYATDFFQFVVLPMFQAYQRYKIGDNPASAAAHLRDSIRNDDGELSSSPDWLLAGEQWMQRRADARAAKAAL